MGWIKSTYTCTLYSTHPCFFAYKQALFRFRASWKLNIKRIYLFPRKRNIGSVQRPDAKQKPSPLSEVHRGTPSLGARLSGSDSGKSPVFYMNVFQPPQGSLARQAEGRASGERTGAVLCAAKQELCETTTQQSALFSHLCRSRWKKKKKKNSPGKPRTHEPEDRKNETKRNESGRTER